ncbi:zinc metalloprotease [Lacibacter luteus]|uniref:Zinc metalloprotease n=1 Tax=Lacibacter luteus TaxID=2508719 RepID=A0A4Q1CI85_9BACT|nr:zinc metalloprotease [Lacibacter luteus]RXK59764.1 zinc metalloprotease [Lacibacter luteus]
MRTKYSFIILLLIVIGCEKTDRQVSAPKAEELFIAAAPGKACRTYEVFLEQLKADPTLKDRMSEIEAFTNRFMQNPAAYRKVVNGVLELPVVVNVLYNTPEQNISDRQIQSQLDVLNEDFAATNRDLFTTNTYNDVKSGDIKIRFVLTQVIRKHTTITAFSTNNAMKYAKRGGIDATSPETSLNMWVCNLGGGILGYAQFPGGNKATDGVVINTLAFGRGGGFGLYTDYDLGRTATHEVGHYFNLRHIWGDRQCGNDYVDDTPLHYTYNFGCPPANKISTCDGGIEMTMNYMDYTDDACMYMFTKGQALRVQATYAIGGPRESLAR